MGVVVDEVCLEAAAEVLTPAAAAKAVQAAVKVGEEAEEPAEKDKRRRHYLLGGYLGAKGSLRARDILPGVG